MLNFDFYKRKKINNSLLRFPGGLCVLQRNISPDIKQSTNMKHNSIKRCAATQISAFGWVQNNAGFNLFLFGKLSSNFHAF